MNEQHWKFLGFAATTVPLAIAPVYPHTLLASSQHAEEASGSWTFHHEYVLGTSLEVRVRARSFIDAQRAERAALTEIDQQDRILSAWRKDSEFSHWASTSFEPVQVSPELFEVLAGFDHWREQTGGALDASAEAAIRLWRQASVEGRRPTDAEIAQTVESIKQPHWDLDPVHKTATRLTDVPLVLASFAKSHVSSRAADAAMRAGATGVMLNMGGDVVARGAMQQVVDIADPRAAAENDVPMERITVRDRAVATSGSYRRGIELARAVSLTAPALSHIIDPRTAKPTGHILSSTVIASDAETAGALATAFSVLSPAESEHLADSTPGVDYLLITANGERIASRGWAAYQVSPLRPALYCPAAFVPQHSAASGDWNPAFELTVGLELPRIDDARYRRPYVAVWIEDADHFPVRTLALWTEKPRWLPELKQWYHDDQIRNLSEGTDISRTVSSATRPPGHYVVKWDGKDNQGKPVKAGKYTVVVEGSREHGGYQVERHELDFDAQAQKATLQPGAELGTVTLDYSKR